MKLPWFDINKRLMCPYCHKSDGVAFVWSDGDSYLGKHEDGFLCIFCKREFTAVYKVEGIKIIGEKKDE